MEDIGWIGLHRKVKSHWLYPAKRKFTEFEAWMHLLLNASFTDSKVMDGLQVIIVKRGDILTSELKLSKDWLWGRDKVRGFLLMLQKDEMISKKSTAKFTIITICNYDSYQDFTTTKPQLTNNKPTARQQQTNTLEEGKEGKEGKEYESRTFSPPTLQQVINHMSEKLDDFTAQGEAQRFIAYYESNGWRVGKNKMKKWEAAAAGWVSRINNYKISDNGKKFKGASKDSAEPGTILTPC
jgi:hypothetical protein